MRLLPASSFKSNSTPRISPLTPLPVVQFIPRPKKRIGVNTLDMKLGILPISLRSLDPDITRQ